MLLGHLVRHPDEGWRVACFLRGAHRLVGATHVAVPTGVLQTCKGTHTMVNSPLADQNRRVDVHWWVMHTGHSRFQGMPLAA